MKVISGVLHDHATADIGKFRPLTSDMSFNQAARSWLNKSLLAKYCGPGKSGGQRSKKAIALFDQMNLRCKDSFVEPDGTSYYDEILYDMRGLLFESLNAWTGPKLTLARCLEHGRHGPGVNNYVKNADFPWKTGIGTLSCTSPKLYAYYTTLTSAGWRSMERERLRSGSGGPPVMGACSKVFTVPKNSEIDRVALKEPSLNMFFQLGAGELLNKVLWQSHRIDLRKQPVVNRLMARIGSVDGSYATIDLSSASDTISYKFVKWLMDSGNFAVLDTIRSHASDRGELYMMSSMGNGFTFPLQTLIFATLVKAVYRNLGIPLGRTKYGTPAYSVFGDDIVVVKQAYHQVCELLNRCGFIVNSEKSYDSGAFRESCGHDYFRGHNIRGVYIRDLRTQQDLYSAFNRLSRWSIRNGISLRKSLRYLLSEIRRRGFNPVPFDTGDTAGVHWPSCLLTNRKFDENGGVYYRCYRPRQRSVRRKLGPWGASIAALGGYLVHREGDNEHWTVIRPKVVRYEVVRESSSSWDWIPYPGLTTQDYIKIYRNL